MHEPIRRNPRRLIILLLTFMLMLIPSEPAKAENVWTKWIQNLRANGFVITQGFASKHSCSDFITVFRDCNGNNPSGLYADILTPIDDTYIDPCYNGAHDCSVGGQNIFTKTAHLSDGTQVTANQFYRVSDSQALVVVVKLPPPAAYFGYQNYVWSRARSRYGQGCTPPTHPEKSPDPCRTLIRADIGNSINHLSIQRKSGLALGSNGTVAFVTTSNKTLFEGISDVFEQSGGDPNWLFAEPLGKKITAGKYSAQVFTGVDADADEMNASIRYSVPEDRAAGDAWIDMIFENIQVFRVRKENTAARFFPTVAMAAKNFTPGESEYQAALDELAGILQTWMQSTRGFPAGSTGMNISPIYSSTGQPTAGAAGPICLRNQKDCKRPTLDTDSYRTASIGKLSRTAIMVGVDSTQTGNAHYIGVGVYRADLALGMYSLEQTNSSEVGFSKGTLRGSASDFVTDLAARGEISTPSANLLSALPKLFVAVVTRECATTSTRFFCAKQYTIKVDPSDIPQGNQIILSRRAYIHPGDLNGANPMYLVNPVVIK